MIYKRECVAGLCVWRFGCDGDAGLAFVGEMVESLCVINP
jgi:hypothetical protein